MPSGQSATITSMPATEPEQALLRLLVRAAADGDTATLLDRLIGARAGDGGGNSAQDATPSAEADQFAAHVIWQGSDPLLPERGYRIRLGAGEAGLRVTDLVHRVDPGTLEGLAAKTLGPGEIGYCKLALDRALAFDPYSRNPATGAFALLDPATDEIVGAGTIDFALRRASNIEWHQMKVTKAARARANA